MDIWSTYGKSLRPAIYLFVFVYDLTYKRREGKPLKEICPIERRSLESAKENFLDE